MSSIAGKRLIVKSGFAGALPFGLSQFLQDHSGQLKVREFFSPHCLIEITGTAALNVFCKDTLHLSPAEGSCNDPAGPAGILALMDSVKPFFDGRRTNAEVADSIASPLSSAFLEFPAILFHNASSQTLYVITLPLPNKVNSRVRQCLSPYMGIFGGQGRKAYDPGKSSHPQRSQRQIHHLKTNGLLSTWWTFLEREAFEFSCALCACLLAGRAVHDQLPFFRIKRDRYDRP